MKTVIWWGMNLWLWEHKNLMGESTEGRVFPSKGKTKCSDSWGVHPTPPIPPVGKYPVILCIKSKKKNSFYNLENVKELQATKQVLIK